MIVPHDPAWADEFVALSGVLSETLGSLAVGIQHVGSTAVPGLAAKPILDLDVVIADWKDFPEVSRVLATLGYDHRGDLGIAGRESFGRMTPMVPFTPGGREWMKHHLYVCLEGGRELKRHLAFRDVLRRDARVARAYEDLKTELAERWPDDRARYSAGKSNFIEAVLER